MKFDEVRQGHDFHCSILDQKCFKGLDSAYINNSIPCHQAIDAEIEEWYGVKTKEWTYIESIHKENNKLFEDVNDKFQLKNLINDQEHSETVSDLKNKLKKHMNEVNDELIPWKDVILEQNLVDEWNSSQRWFKRPIEELV